MSEMISPSPSQASASCRVVSAFHGCGNARRCRQSNDFGWWQSTKLRWSGARDTSRANGFPSLFKLDVMGKPMTMLVRALNARGDRTSIGCMSRISRPACGLQSIQMMSPRSGTQLRGGLRATVTSPRRRRGPTPQIRHRASSDQTPPVSPPASVFVARHAQ